MEYSMMEYSIDTQVVRLWNIQPMKKMFHTNTFCATVEYSIDLIISNDGIRRNSAKYLNISFLEYSIVVQIMQPWDIQCSMECSTAMEPS